MALWDQVVQALQEEIIVICTILSFVVPFTVYKVNQKLHEYGDPPWKKHDGEN